MIAEMKLSYHGHGTLFLQGRLADSYPEHSLPLRKRLSYVGVNNPESGASPPALIIKSAYKENISPPAPCLLRPGVIRHTSHPAHCLAYCLAKEKG